jgi:hypothetical protein
MGSEKRHIAVWRSVQQQCGDAGARVLTQDCELTDGKPLGVVFEGDHD